MRKKENSGLSSVTDPVSLKVLSWNVAGLAENCADIFLSQISMLTDWDVLLLQECFRKLDGVDVGVHKLFTPSELLPAEDAASLCIWTSSVTWILLLFSSSWFLPVKASSMSDKPRVGTDIDS